ncbi:MAG TPA: DUF4157 domain-containing protein [Pyrinomonadaceae bacterium]|nr:DUF4157 domain-containing protein [Pyrinomonadaceae bacterium]
MRVAVEKSGADAPAGKKSADAPARVSLRAESSSRQHGASQTRLRVSEPGDASEFLAESAAERVLSARTDGPPADAGAAPAVIQHAAVDSGVPVAEREPLVPRGGGQPLPASARDFFEPRFRNDLGDVRVHTGADAAEAAKSLAARGYAVGRHVVFGAGQFAPGTPAGDRLLAHELAHVVYGAHEPVVHRDASGPLPVEVPDPDDVSTPDIKYLWQNLTLRNSIYPYRDEMLSFFLRTYMEIDLNDPATAAAKIKTLSTDDLKLERGKLEQELKEIDENIKSVEKEIKGAQKAKDEEKVNDLTQWVRPFYFRKHRLEGDLNYLPRLTAKGTLPSGAAKRWTAYQYSKYNDVGLELMHDELLARILDRFDADTTFTRYPKWLRYMVIHFSGMRYQSAHRSYAPATDLVRRLKTEQIKHEVGAASQLDVISLKERAVLDIEAELDATGKPNPRRAATLKTRLAALKAVETERAAAFSQKGQEAQRADFAELTKLEDERALLTSELDEKLLADAAQKRLDELDPLIKAAEAKLDSKPLKRVRERLHAAEEKRRAAVVEHELEKAAAAFSTLDDTQAVSVLRAMRANKVFPEWTWREIVRVTALKLEVEAGEDWERVTPEEDAEKNRKDPATVRWREIMKEWKKDVTAWREKHGKDLSLVVVRAVCNEIAEMCLHARGIKPDGGINQKAQWYAGKSKGASFSRPKSVADLKPGSSLFFLQWSYTPPADPISVVRSDTVGLQSDKGEPISDGFKGAGNWTYHFNADNTVTRTQPVFGPVISPSAPQPIGTQYLTWLHEAQIVEVDDKRGRVLTFETGPIGLRTRSLESVLNVWSVYLGFAPSGAEPADIDKYLKDILPGR